MKPKGDEDDKQTESEEKVIPEIHIKFIDGTIDVKVIEERGLPIGKLDHMVFSVHREIQKVRSRKMQEENKRKQKEEGPQEEKKLESQEYTESVIAAKAEKDLPQPDLNQPVTRQ